MKKLSNKNEKMSGKARTVDPSSAFCWICHQDVGLKAARQQLSEVLQKEFVKPLEAFTPCLCKGSIGVVHQECLNRWVLEKYRAIIMKTPKIEQEDELPIICCPNCKMPYDYTVTEIRKFSGLKGLKLISVESVCLFLLLMCQIGVVMYDMFYSEKIEDNKQNEDPNDESGAVYFKISQYLHLFTVIIVICAGGFNLLENSQKQTVIQVLSK